MIKNIVISFEEQKEESRGSVEFQVLVSLIRYEDLLHIWNCTEKIIYLSGVYEKFWEKRQRLLAYLSKKNRVRYKELINQLNIRELKTR